MLVWHCEHRTEVCLPVSGKDVRVLWSNDAGFQSAVAWQRLQSCGNAAATWLGVVVCWNFVRWQPAHCMAVPANLLPAWQVAQAAVVCLPVSGNLVRAV